MLSNLTIKQIREIRGYSQEYMATKLQISQPAYCKIENGKSKTKDQNYKLIAEILEVNINYIRVNIIPVFFYVDDFEKEFSTKNSVDFDYIKLIINNIIEQRTLLYKLFENENKY
jgi:transcriptional regulator with XRE-family HTH domain